jgi:DNA polymerase
MTTHSNLRCSDEQATLLRVVRSLRTKVEDLLAQGEEDIRRLLPATAATQPQARQERAERALPASAPPPPIASEARALASAHSPDLFAAAELSETRTLEEVRAVLGDCRRCKLCSNRTQIVFGVGNPHAQLMFVGEGPGRDEDLQGEPFVGRAGQLLTDIITRGMKMRREDVYIANVVKCRPPENRNPEPDEVAACLPFLERQIEIVQPRVLVALGKVAAQALLRTNTPISRLRGQWHSYRGIPLMPTLHPAYLLRNPADKRLVWEDIKLVIRELEKRG